MAKRTQTKRTTRQNRLRQHKSEGPLPDKKGSSKRLAMNPKKTIVVNESEIVHLWSAVGLSKGLSSDNEIAKFLLSLHFDGNPNKLEHDTSMKAQHLCVNCKGPVMLYCVNCQLTSELQPSSQLSTSFSAQLHLPGTNTHLSQLSEGIMSSQSQFSTAVFQSENKLFQSSLPFMRNETQPSQTQTETVLNFPSSAAATVCNFKGGNPSSFNGTLSQSHLFARDETPHSSKQAVMPTTNGHDSFQKDALDGCDSVRMLIPSTYLPENGLEDNVNVYTDLSGTEMDSDGKFADISSLSSKKPAQAEGPVKFLCPYCNMVFDTSPECKSHVRVHDGLADTDGTFTCNACSKTFQQFNSLFRHIKLRSDQQRCSQCEQVFRTRCEISRHVKNHDKEKATFCDTCNKAYPSMSRKDFISHLKKHSRNNSSSEDRALQEFLCSQCGKVFRKKEDLKLHMTYHNKESPFVCTFPLCGKAFKNKGCLRQHRLTHSEKTQQCEMCGAKFARKCGLRRHMQKHFGKKFHCTACQRKYCSSHELQLHVKTVHKGIRRYACTMCQTMFYSQTCLTKHVRTHTGERPYQCDECPARFAVKGSLKKHKRRHTGEKPYHCEDCGLMYSCQKSYKLHRQKHHSDKMYICHCGVQFDMRSSLAFHIKMCHDDELLVRMNDSCLLQASMKIQQTDQTINHEI